MHTICLRSHRRHATGSTLPSHASPATLCRATAATAIAILGISPWAARATNVSWAVNSSGTWSSPANWSPAGLPGPSDDVTINRPAGLYTTTLYSETESVHSLTSNEKLYFYYGNLTIAAPSSITAALDSYYGTITANADLTLSGGGNWNYLGLAGVGKTKLAAGATTTLDFYLNVNAHTLENAGTFRVTQNSHGMTLDNATFSNLAGARFSVATPVTPGVTQIYDAHGASSGSSTFNNAGAFDHNSTFMTLVTAQFNNTGTINVNTGTVVFNAGGNHAGGTFNMAAGATLQFNGGTHVITPTTTFNGQWELGGDGYATPPLVLSVAGGDNILSGLTWSSGTITGAGTSTIPAGGTLLVSGGGGTLDGRALANAGTLTISHGGITPGPGATLTNLPGGTVNLDVMEIANPWSDPAVGPFNNAGIINVVTAGTTWAPFNNTGTIALAPNAYLFAGFGGTIAGTITGGDGARIVLRGQTNSPLVIDSSAVLNVPSITLESSARFTGDSTFTNSGTLIISGGSTLQLSGPMISTGTLTLTGRLDVVDEQLTITAPADAVRQLILAGHIVSSMADPTSSHSIGYAPAGSALLVRRTVTGDANLDGTITADDYTLLDKGFASIASTWWLGDFNHDGQVTSADYLLIDRAYLLQVGSPSADFLATREARFGDQYVSDLLTAIPEPSTLAAAGVALLPLVRRRTT